MCGNPWTYFHATVTTPLRTWEIMTMVTLWQVVKVPGDALLSWASSKAAILGVWEDEKKRNRQYYFCS